MNNWDKSIKAITSAVDRTDYLYEKWAKKLGVNNYVSRIMYMLYLSEVNRQKEMVENYGMPKQTVNTVITELQKKGYIILIPDENDKRSKIIKLTQEGINYANKIVTPLLDCEIRVLKKNGYTTGWNADWYYESVCRFTWNRNENFLQQIKKLPYL